eukprot:1160498-Pelagomonas_calceolata.AAC.4
MPVDAHTAALLQELLSEPLVEEEEHHARLDGRDVGFDMGGQGKPLSRDVGFDMGGQGKPLSRLAKEVRTPLNAGLATKDM